MKDGLELHWHGNGVLKQEIPYANGRKNGIAREWLETGELRTVNVYKAGKRQPLQVYETGDGQMGMHVYELSESSTRIEWYANGVMKLEEPLVNGKVTGTVRTWYESGAKKSETYYKDQRGREWQRSGMSLVENVRRCLTKIT